MLVEKVTSELGIEFFGANNSFVFNKNNKLVEIKIQGKDSSFKVNRLNKIIEELKISPYECICIGDGINDRELFDLTEHGITFKGSRIENKAWKVINELSDLKSLL